MTPIPSGFGQIEVILTSPQGHNCEWTIAVDASDPGFDLGDFGDWLVLATGDGFRHQLASVWSIDSLIFTTATSVVEVPYGLSGTASATTWMPPQVAALFKKITGLRGRKNRGRMYWPGVLPEADVGNEGSLGSTRRTALTDSVTAMIAAMTLGNMTPVILHGDGSTPTPITGIETELFTATQRRRLVRD